MKSLLFGFSLIALVIASGRASAQPLADSKSAVAVHTCESNPFLRSTGLFGGEQPEIFLAGPYLRREPPPAADGSIRVLNVTAVDDLKDPGADPVIDKCASRLQWVGLEEVELTILWRDRNCHDTFDEEDLNECRARARFRFKPGELGLQGGLGSEEDPHAALQRLFVVDAYFTQEIEPTGRHSATGMPKSVRADVHLVARLIRAP